MGFSLDGYISSKRKKGDHSGVGLFSVDDPVSGRSGSKGPGGFFQGGSEKKIGEKTGIDLTSTDKADGGGPAPKASRGFSLDEYIIGQSIRSGGKKGEVYNNDQEKQKEDDWLAELDTETVQKELERLQGELGQMETRSKQRGEERKKAALPASTYAAAYQGPAAKPATSYAAGLQEGVTKETGGQFQKKKAEQKAPGGYDLLPTPTGRNEEEELRGEVRQRTQLANGVTPLELAGKAAVNQLRSYVPTSEDLEKQRSIARYEAARGALIQDNIPSYAASAGVLSPKGTEPVVGSYAAASGALKSEYEKGQEERLRELGEASAELQLPPVPERFGLTLSGAGKQYAGSLVQAAKTVLFPEVSDSLEAQIEKLNVEGERREALMELADLQRERREEFNRIALGMQDTADQLTQSGAEDIAKAQEGLDPAGRLLVNAGVGVAQMAGDAAAAFATGGSSMLPMVVRSFGGGVQEARQKGYGEGQQVLLGLSSAATEFFSEKLFGGNPVYDSDVGLVNRLVGKIIKNPKVMEFLASAPMETLNEGLEEIVSDILNPVAEWAITGNRPEYELDQIIEDGAVGVLTALIAKGGAKGINRVSNAVSGLADNATVDKLLNDRDTIRFLTKKGGLKLTKDMTQAQKRAEMKRAISNVARGQKTASTGEAGKNLRLTDADVAEYLAVGKTKSIRDAKAAMVKNGEKVLLTNKTETTEFIGDAIRGVSGQSTKAYGKVGTKMAQDIQSTAGEDVDVAGWYLELVPDDIHHAYRQHLTAKRKGNIDLTEQDFLNIPDYIDTYDDILEYKTFRNGDREVVLGKKINGYSVIVELLSNKRRSLHFKNMWGLDTETYESRYGKSTASHPDRSSVTANDPTKVYHSASSEDTILQADTEVKDQPLSTTVESSLVDDETAGKLLLNPDALRSLKKRGGLKLAKDMTEAQKKAAVKEAVKRATGGQKTASGEGDGETHYSLKGLSKDEIGKAYQGKDLSKDSSVYSYQFLTSLPDMTVTVLPEVSSIRGQDGRIDTRTVVDLGMENAKKVGVEKDGKIFIPNDYTGRELRVSRRSIGHGLNGDLNRLLTNARLGAAIGDIVKNAVPINALKNKADGVIGTYAMVSYATDAAGREFVAVITVEQRTNEIVGMDIYDNTHSVSGRQKRSDTQVGTKPPRKNASMNVTKITIAELLDVVKSTHQSILSEDVLSYIGEVRSENGYYSDKVLFSIKDPETTETTSLSEEGPSQDIHPLTEADRSRFATEAGSERGLILDDYVQKRLRPETAELVNTVAKALGVRVRFVNSIRSGTANASIRGDEIRIERYNPNPVLYLLGHELTHRIQELAPKEYSRFKEAVQADVEQEAQALHNLYQSRGVRMDFAGALDEATANYAGRLIQNGTVLDEFIEKHRTDRSILERVLDAIRDMIGKLTGQEKKNAQSAGEKLAAALDQAAKKAGKNGAATKGGEEQFLIKYDLNNNPFVYIDTDILTGVPKNEWINTVKKTLAFRFPNGVQVGRNTIKINRKTRREMTYSEYTKWLAKHDKNTYADKFRAAGYADEIILASRDYINEGLKHTRNDNIRDFARGSVLLRVGGTDYKADVIVGTTSSGQMLLYDIVNLEQTTIREKQTHRTAQPFGER